jgi:predicted transposase/invertase (TIGR01784 family)
MLRLLDPKNDFAFKRVFGVDDNKDILIAFLNAIFEGVHNTIEDVEFLPLHQDPKIAALRQSIIDVKCSDSKNRQFIIEMQCYSDSAFLKRACVYAARAYADQAIDGVSYRDIKPVIFLAILDFKLLDEDKYLSHNKLLDVETGKCNIEEFSFSFLELKKFNKSIAESRSPLEKWCCFLKHAQTMEPNEIDMIRKEYPIVGKAYKALDQYGYSKEELDEYIRYDMKDDEIATRISDAGKLGEAKGKAEGLIEGELKKAQEAAISMLKDGLSIATISKYTRLSIEEIESLGLQ